MLSTRLALIVVWLLTATHAAQVGAAEIRLNGQTFTLPAGFEIELAAGPPLADRPITADFDEQGRLYVADSSGSNDKVDKQLVDRTHRIVRLEDTDHDGRFDKQTIFADKMMFPEGTLWFQGSLYVAAPPSIWKLTDRDGDGVADERVEWFAGKTLTGCANDLHGPYLGRDGWIYWCKGAFAQQKYDIRGRELVTRAAHIFRARPDGSLIEPVMTGGMDNPVDVVFTPGGERIFSTTFFQHPGGGQRDGLIHAVYGGLYGKPHDVLEGHIRTSPDLLPVLVHMGPAAPAGLACLESAAWGPEYQHNVFTAQFNLQKVSRHVLTPRGATFQSQDSDLVTSTNRDFHPTDVLEDADGSLLVVDTGGWYKLCCPTSQLSKPDVFGAIYRVRRTGAPKVADPRASKVAWSTLAPAQLATYLGDARPAAVRRATEELAARGDVAAQALAEFVAKEPSAAARRNAVWASAWIDAPGARKVARAAFADTDRVVRSAAAHVAGLVRDRDASEGLSKLLTDPDPHVHRAAAEALGRAGDGQATRRLLLEGVPQAGTDRIALHSITYALIEIGDAAICAAALASAGDPAMRRAALIALDQMPRSTLKPEEVAALLNDRFMKEPASWVLSRHLDWGDALTGYLAKQLAAELAADDRRKLEAQLAGFARTPAVQKLLAEQATGKSAAAQASALRAIAQSGLRETPAAWVAAIAPLLQASEGKTAEVTSLAVAAARSVQVPKPRAGELAPLRAALLSLASDESQTAELRLDALAAVPGGAGELTAPAFAFLRSQLTPERAALARATAADVLGKARLSLEQQTELAAALGQAGPLEIDRLLAAYEGLQDERVGLAVIAALRGSAVLAALRVESLTPRFSKLTPPAKAEAEKLYALIRAQQAEQHARLEELLKSLAEGDARRGQLVFNSQKAACASCHAIGYLGGNIGPDLTKIGQIRQQRDLLEAILYPSASFVRSYEPWTVVTADGRAFTGVLRNEGAHEITLVKAPREELRVLRSEIEELQPATVSIMPAGLDKQLSPQELADLLAFLRACK